MEQAAARHGLELVDVSFRQEGGAWHLRVFLDRPGGLRLEDCETVSGELSRFLDATDPIPQRYYLEVSSPGEERPLRRESAFVRYPGEPHGIAKPRNRLDRLERQLAWFKHHLGRGD
jgi:ribosome maturation factor RimP